LQVELAQLEYTYPRLRHMWTHLERIAGGAATASASVDLDLRLARSATQLKREIAAIDRRKMRQVRGRQKLAGVCLVGYTNAGKSTLMNLLTGAEVFVADQLFATLDTRTRRWKLGDGGEVLLSDTVGFVRDLPHHLVASFRATLEEAIHADLLLHVADASDERVDHQIEAVNAVLTDLDAPAQRQLLLLNKVDRIVDPTVRTVLAARYPEALFISAKTGSGASELVEAVAHRTAGPPVRLTVEANCAAGKLMHFISQHGKIERESYHDATAEIQLVLSADRLAKLKTFGPDVAIVDGPHPL